MKHLVFFLSLINILLANPLQEAIDIATPYSTLKLSTGTYLGNIIINKPLSIVGKNDGVIIKGLLKGSVIKIRSNHVILKNLIITDSGARMDRIDSAISIKQSSNVEINNCKILNSLYGIDMDMVHKSKIINNYITSKD